MSKSRARTQPPQVGEREPRRSSRAIACPTCDCDKLRLSAAPEGDLATPSRSMRRHSSRTLTDASQYPAASPLLVVALAVMLVALIPVQAVTVLRPRALLPTSWSSDKTRLPLGSTRVGQYICRVQGDCEPCPSAELATPVCAVHGNRRRLVCGAAHSSSNTKSHSDFESKGATSASAVPSPPAVKDGAEDSPEQLGRLHFESNAPDAREPLSPEGGDRELLELDPDPEGLDDEELKDQLRDDVNSPRRQRRRRRDTDIEDSGSNLGASAEILTWEACQRVVKREKEDYFEFVLCNLFFSCGSIALLIYRHRVLASRQYGRLAARIGLSVTR